ncbi:MAG: hypothetical protein RQ754_01330 [Desulfuromonadales bacterium]|jgi:hypothetical protein|nr:hypothetical protein [Desulfuromonadales bacterium]
MKRYKIQLKGENFLLNLSGEPRKFGFHATKYIKAADPEIAEKMAIIMIRQTPELRNPNLSGRSDRPRILLESIREVNPLLFFFKQRSTLLTFHTEEDGF